MRRHLAPWTFKESKTTSGRTHQLSTELCCSRLTGLVQHCGLLQAIAGVASMDLIALHLDQGIKGIMDAGGHNALHHVCRVGNLEEVQCFLHLKASAEIVNNDGKSALLFAVGRCHQHVLDALINHGAGVNAKRTVLYAPHFILQQSEAMMTWRYL